jgi:allophanate hydrolase
VNPSISGLLEAYREGRSDPREIIESVIARQREAEAHNVWISRVPADDLRRRAAALARQSPESLPLYGIPFAVKDNIDLAGLATTAACPSFAFMPEASAPVVQKLLDAGAIALGKSNMDQFATGLVGTRSPYGICRNSFDRTRISGGSSSGSAVAVALGLASFGLGTDTAGSGRVPAAFNNLVGYKPTLGLLSTRGVVPACRSLDAVSVFALTAEDAALVARVAGGFDPLDPFARPARLPANRGWSQRAPLRFAVPDVAQREFPGNEAYARLFEQSITALARVGGEPVSVDIAPLLEAARLLYQGPWVTERFLAVGSLIESRPEALLPVTRQVIAGGARGTARETFRAMYRLRELRRLSEAIWSVADVLLLPTVPSHPTIAEVEADPVLRNTELGHYTNFVNLLDLAAVAVPAGFTGTGLPFGVTLVAPAWHDAELLALASRLQRACVETMGATGHRLADTPPGEADCGDTIDVAVCGAHMQGLPLNQQLLDRNAWLRTRTWTAPEYRLYALPGGPPQRPGLLRVDSGGNAIEVEVWRMPAERFGDFVAGIPAPLGIGRIRLADGGEVAGFLCEAHGVAQARDITALGGWRRFLATG